MYISFKFLCYQYCSSILYGHWTSFQIRVTVSKGFNYEVCTYYIGKHFLLVCWLSGLFAVPDPLYEENLFLRTLFYTQRGCGYESWSLDLPSNLTPLNDVESYRFPDRSIGMKNSTKLKERGRGGLQAISIDWSDHGPRCVWRGGWGSRRHCLSQTWRKVIESCAAEGHNPSRWAGLWTLLGRRMVCPCQRSRVLQTDERRFWTLFSCTTPGVVCRAIFNVLILGKRGFICFIYLQL